MEYKKVTFDISGDYITNLMRDWFYKEGKPYSKVEEVLLDCLICDQIDVEQRKEIARDIIIGRKKLTGNTREGTYRVESDNVEQNLFSTLTKTINDLRTQLDDTKSELKDTTDKYLDLYDGVSSQSVEGVEYEDNKNVLIDLFKAYGDYHAAQERSYDDMSPMLKDYFATSKFDDNYGWLKPNGEFIPVDFGNHLDYAKQVLTDNDWDDEFYEWHKSEENWHKGNGVEGDFLVYEKGWVLMHNPAQGIAHPSMGDKLLTKAQREFLFDYYTKREQPDLANEYFSE